MRTGPISSVRSVRAFRESQVGAMKQPGRPVMAAAVPAAPHLIGRAAELEVLSGLLDRVAERGGALVVRGEPGVGETVLLDSLLAGAAGCVIARVAGVESAMELAFARW